MLDLRNVKITVKILSNHLLCWTALIAYEVYGAFLSVHTLSFLRNYLMYYSCNIIIFYTQAGILNSTLGGKYPKYYKLVFLTCVVIVFFLVVKLNIDYLTTDFNLSPASKLTILKSMGILDLLRNLYFVAFGSLYWSLRNVGKFRERAIFSELKRVAAARDNAKLEAKLAGARSAFLQQQISPHLLLNSLSFIHASVFKVSEEAAESIILLSDIFRFSLEPPDNEGKIDLILEIQQIENLVRINRYRFGGNLDVRFKITGSPQGHRIIPLIISTLTENIFKHGDLSKKPAIISLIITDDGSLTFETENYKRPVPPYQRLRSNGIENCRIRLDYTYGENYDLQIVDSGEIFSVQLKIDL
ncbi:sensor histidine kinase [Mucilaginibacter endophyticus]|uniref:sensor histidine kinase n=1 Tax=Mucilaginibacter endophyticus TaxID=2675003 RepID=UPI000E0D2AD3|nr:histidine kinase [Mucilaginibacter endophyticus]